MLRALRAVSLAMVVIGSGAIPAAAQTSADGRGPVFRVEPEARTAHSRPGFVTGWVYNDGRGVAGLVRMKCEVLDTAGKVVAEHIGWAYGNVSPGGRAYFMIPVPPKTEGERRVTVESYVLQSITESP
jgi:hypothetical protein